MPFGISTGAGLAIAGAVGAAGAIGGGMMQSGATKAAAEDAAWAQMLGTEMARRQVGEWTGQGENALVKAADYAGVNGGPQALQADEAARFRTSAIYGQNALAPPVANVPGQLAGIYGPEQAQAAMANFYTSPGYEWRLQQGVRALEAGNAASHMLRSGATLKAEQEYGQGLASQEFGNYFTRASQEFGNNFNREQGAFNDYYNRLYNLAAMGSNAASHVATGMQQAGAGIAQTYASAGQQQSNIIGNTANSLGNIAQNMANQQAYYNALTPASAPVTQGAVGGGMSMFAPAAPYGATGGNLPMWG